VDIGTTIRLAGLADEGTHIVSESGISTGQDVERLAAAGVRAILVGQTLMQSDDVAAKVAELCGR
jgi:indole-3-glycerol phosphate synthase